MGVARLAVGGKVSGLFQMGLQPAQPLPKATLERLHASHGSQHNSLARSKACCSVLASPPVVKEDFFVALK